MVRAIGTAGDGDRRRACWTWPFGSTTRSSAATTCSGRAGERRGDSIIARRFDPRAIGRGEQAMNASELVSDDAPAIPATSHRVARNSVLYFVSLGIPALAALIFVPVTVRALGPARFGLLALAWAAAESTGVFDFGLGKATIRFVADATARSAERLKAVVVASLLTQTAMGALAGLLFSLIAP